MAHFWTKLQISGIILSPNKQPTRLLINAENLLNNILRTDLRTIFFWKRSDKAKSNKDCRPSVCGKPLPERPQPCNPKCSSKCLQINSCQDKELAKRKLSNCRDTAKNEEKKSYWEILFGWKTEVEKKPDLGTCRNAYCKRRASLERDPRLCDPRYEATAGDVLIFTENPRVESCESQEPRPKPPPSYKLPKAVMTKRITEEAGKTPHNCAAALQFDPSCDALKCSGPKASILPFEELRPPEMQRKLFSCRHGLRSRDVAKPTRTDANSCESCGTSRISDSLMNLQSNKSGDSSDFSMYGTRGNSRVEQLKKITRAKEGGKCSELFDRNSLNVSQCRTPCNPSSCKMSTLCLLE